MAEKELSKGKQLEKELCWEYPNIAKKAPEQREKAHEFAKGYMEFLGACKTERECVNYAEKLLLEAGYERFDSKKKYKAGDKVFSTKSRQGNGNYGLRQEVDCGGRPDQRRAH